MNFFQLSPLSSLQWTFTIQVTIISILVCVTGYSNTTQFMKATGPNQMTSWFNYIDLHTIIIKSTTSSLPVYASSSPSSIYNPEDKVSFPYLTIAYVIIYVVLFNISQPFYTWNKSSSLMVNHCSEIVWALRINIRAANR